MKNVPQSNYRWKNGLDLIQVESAVQKTNLVGTQCKLSWFLLGLNNLDGRKSDFTIEVRFGVSNIWRVSEGQGGHSEKYYICC